MSPMTTHLWIGFGAVEPTRCRRRIGADDDDCVWEITRDREPHGTLYTGRADVRAAIVEAFKALPTSITHRFGILSARTMSWWNAWLPLRSVTAAKPSSTPATSPPSGTG